MKVNDVLTSESAMYFRNQLRESRTKALRDAEAFQEIMFVVERLGGYLTNRQSNKGQRQRSLGAYTEALCSQSKNSALAHTIPLDHRPWHIPFDILFDIVKTGRNDAFHQGAYARHLTEHAVLLALVLEDSLMTETSNVSDYMVRNPICALPWQPVSFARQQMLANSFTYLPMRSEDEGKWSLIADFHIAQFLRGATSKEDRNQLLGNLLSDAISQGRLQTIPANLTRAIEGVDQALAKMTTGQPLLVVHSDEDQELVGILAPFDLL